MKKRAVKEEAKEAVTLEHALSIFAYHVGEIMRCTDRVCVHFYGGVTGDYTIVPSPGGIDPTGAWDQAFMNGGCIGNRSAAREDYAKRCAPILAQIAAGTYVE